MKHLLVLGAGTAGTMVANKMHRKLAAEGWQITLVDPEPNHYYQPGFLFVPFDIYKPSDVVKPKRRFIPKGVNLIEAAVMVVDGERQQVQLSNGQTLSYDYLVIATGTHPRPDQTEGLEGPAWRRNIHDFYTYEGSVALADYLRGWEGGRLSVHITEMPIKCPVAPLEFIFLADDYFRKQGLRDRVELQLVTPLPGVFTKPIAAGLLGDMFEKRNINVVPDFAVDYVDSENNQLVSFDEQVVDYDLLVSIPTNMGADFVGTSGLGDELNHVLVDKHTLLSKKYDNIFALGDAAATPTSKAGSVAHFQVDLFSENFWHYVQGGTLAPSFDGHANCFIESGDGKGILIDFNYDVEPLPGHYPLPMFGPFALLKETQMNHLGKMAFYWMYWNLLLPGRPLPLPSQMQMVGKKKIDPTPQTTL